jgi:GntR family transcriptional regulator
MTIDKGTSGDIGASPTGSGGGGSEPDRQGGPASPIEFRLDAASGVPTYLQLVHQVEHALRLGYLKLGDQLPKVRDVVASLAINPNTVLKAYRELEHDGLLAARPGVGTFVTRTLTDTTLAAHGPLRRDLQRWLSKARLAGLDDESIEALFTTTFRSAAGEQEVA